MFQRSLISDQRWSLYEQTPHGLTNQTGGVFGLDAELYCPEGNAKRRVRYLDILMPHPVVADDDESEYDECARRGTRTLG